MLGRLPTGSDAIAFRNTLFRVSELCWIKAVRLSIPEHIVRVLAVVFAVLWVTTMESAKATYYNVEFLIAGFPLVLAWTMSSSLKIGCSGDFEETYDQRHGMRSSLFRGWIEGLKAREPGWVYLKGSSYDMLFNPNRMAWIRPTIQWSLFPLIVTAVYGGYLYVLRTNIEIPVYPVLSDFAVLTYPGGKGALINLCYAILATSIAAFVLSLKRGVEICGTGGVQDTFPMSGADQRRLLELMAGATTPGAAKAPPKTQPVEVKAKRTEKKEPVAAKAQVVAKAPVATKAPEPVEAEPVSQAAATSTEEKADSAPNSKP